MPEAGSLFREPATTGSQLSPQQEIFDILQIYARQSGPCLGALLETVRDQKRIVDLQQVNRVLMQPHWRNNHAVEA